MYFVYIKILYGCVQMVCVYFIYIYIVCINIQYLKCINTMKIDYIVYIKM